MTEATYQETKAPLGVGSIIGDAFSILFRNFGAVVLLGFAPALIAMVASVALIGMDAALGTGQPDFSNGLDAVNFLVAIFFGIAMVSVATAMMVQMAYDVKLGRAKQYGTYFSAALRNLPAILVLSIATVILYSIGAVFFLVPGLWIYAVFSVIVPAIVIENAGFGAMGRSATLTKEYRWPIVGTLILVGLCTMVLAMVATFATLAISGLSGVIGLLLQAVLNGFVYGLFSITVALIFARLKEIKEGVSVTDLADVFR